MTNSEAYNLQLLPYRGGWISWEMYQDIVLEGNIVHIGDAVNGTTAKKFTYKGMWSRLVGTFPSHIIDNVAARGSDDFILV